MKKHYDEATAIRAVAKKCSVDYGSHTIGVNTSTGLVGNGTWGKIDYLCHYCGWHWNHISTVVIEKTSDKPIRKRKTTDVENNNKNVKPKKMK